MSKKPSNARPHPYALLLLLLLAGSIAASLVAGAPTTLPAISLDSELLFHIERVLAVLACALLLLVILVEAWKGNLPAEISERGLKYERLKEETRAGLEALSEAIAEERKVREQAAARDAKMLDSTTPTK